jgi:hypothetical protein
MLLSLFGTGEHQSWEQENVLDRGPAPESVLELNSPLDVPFLPLAPIPWAFTTLRDGLREGLKPHIETLSPFFRDTQVGLNLRLYYFNRDNDVTPSRSDNEAFTIGGSLAYQSDSLTANTQNITSPYGSYPGYLSLSEKDCNRAGEKAWLLGFMGPSALRSRGFR